MNNYMPVDPWLEQKFLALHHRVVTSNLHHGLLLSGEQGIGKQRFAQALALSLLCQHPQDKQSCTKCQGCLLYKGQTHPDLLVIESEKQIGVDAIRQLSSKLHNTAQIGPNKVCILLGAETMTEAAANALLKTLEEPTENTFLLLVSDAPHKLLPTILSRCEKQSLPRPQPEQTRHWIKNLQPDVPIPDALFTIFSHSPYELQKYLGDDTLPEVKNFESQLNQVKLGEITALSLSKRWEGHGALLLNLCSGLLYKRYIETLNASDYAPYKHCIHSQQRLAQVGINKILLLQSVIETTALSC